MLLKRALPMVFSWKFRQLLRVTDLENACEQLVLATRQFLKYSSNLPQFESNKPKITVRDCCGLVLY